MSSRPKSVHLFITCSGTGDLQEKEDVDSVVKKLFRSSSNGKYTQVINTNLINPKFLPILRYPYWTWKSKKSYSGMVWRSFLRHCSKRSVGSNSYSMERCSHFVTMGFAFNQHQELWSIFFNERISGKKEKSVFLSRGAWIAKERFAHSTAMYRMNWFELIFPY